MRFFPLKFDYNFPYYTFLNTGINISYQIHRRISGKGIPSMDKRWNVPSPRGYRRKKILLVLSAANPNALFHRHSRLEFEARAQNTTTEARKRSSSWATADFLARFHGDRSRGRHAPLRSSRSDRAISDHRLLITSPPPRLTAMTRPCRCS